MSEYDGSGYEESLDNDTCAYPTSDEEADIDDDDDDGLDGDESGKHTIPYSGKFRWVLFCYGEPPNEKLT